MIIKEIDKGPIEAFVLLRDLELPFILSGGKMPWQGRYSFIGAAPFATITTDVHGKTTIEWEEIGHGRQVFPDPFCALSKLLPEFMRTYQTPFPFSGGAVGYFSYDLKNLIGDTGPLAKVAKGPDELSRHIPLCYVGLYDPVLVYDHQADKGFLVSACTGKWRSRLERIEETLHMEPRKPHRLNGGTTSMTFCESNLTKQEYLLMVEKALEYISAGDIYQINLSQRLKIPLSVDPLTVYLTLVERSLPRFGSFMDCGSFQVISNSPERLIRVKGDRVETEPIKGTRPRGKDPEHDKELVEELRLSPKERAEHLMIVDLERNDLGRISMPSTVVVEEFERIETYPTLHHMVSTISARLLPDVDSPTALMACFPGGSITGTPKIRAMEIIDELEPFPRRIYTGGIGWIDFNGDMDVAMAIRTAVCMDRNMYINVGGGIVADSDPEEEYMETLLKAEDFLRLLGAAECI